ncbi:MAG: hypothetical protein H6745_15820 [Deltaproteobacteria bacterium]|nr:hypothetical protein [Deltaproteobacteria bacterium]
MARGRSDLVGAQAPWFSGCFGRGLPTIVFGTGRMFTFVSCPVARASGVGG